MNFLASLNESLHRLFSDNEDIFLIGEDLCDPYGGAFKVSRGLSSKYPERVLSTPISEGLIVGMAGGMAMDGLLPIVEIMFGDFLSLTVDQLLNHLTKYEAMYNHKVSVPVTIRAAMGGRRGYGPTHSQSLEPLLATIPLLKIISPSHYHDAGALLETTVLREKGIKIFSEYKLLYPRILVNESNVRDGLSLRYSDSAFPTAFVSNADFDDPEILFVSHGGNSMLLEEVLVDLLLEDEIAAEAVFPSMIKPFPYADISDRVESASCLVFVEESPTSHGWSSELIAHMVESRSLQNKKFMRFGAKDLPLPSAIHLEEQVLPSKKRIIAEIHKIRKYV